MRYFDRVALSFYYDKRCIATLGFRKEGATGAVPIF